MRRSAGTLSVILCLMIVWPLILQAQSRGIRVKAKDNTTGEQREIQLYREMIAVVIGINEYPDLGYDQQLSYAVSDAKAVEKVLRERYQFDRIYTLYNREATKDAIIELLQGTLAKTQREDAVFVFFAGHAITEKSEFGEMGYLVPYDGTFNRDELYHNLSMSMLKTDISRRIKAKHVFYVVDACYGGLLLALRGSDRETEHDLGYLQEMTKEPVRQVLTAGSKDQPVLDGGPKGHSVFTGRLIEALEGTTDYITGGELSEKIKRKVYSDAQARGHTQTPQDGALFGTGDFVFVPKIMEKSKKPPGGDFSINGFEEEASQIEANKAAWQEFLSKMQTAFNQVENLQKRALAPGRKADAWGQFLDAFGDDNPYSQEDDTMRRKARQQVSYWQEEARRKAREAERLRKEEAQKKVKKRPAVVSGLTLPNMVSVKGGTFQMGDQFGDGSSNEKPVHTVTVSGFYMGATEVTVAQWREYVRESGISFDWNKNSWGDYPVAKYSPEEDCPIINVSWNQAVAYCKWLSKKTGDHYRLPTEAEWEYAARSGGKKEKWAGTSSSGTLSSYAWYSSNAGGKTHSVGQKQPNGLGLYDMAGNVWEWCSDWYDGGYYKNSPRNNPTGPSSGASRVFRGGSWGGGASDLRCADRAVRSPVARRSNIGFRLCKNAP